MKENQEFVAFSMPGSTDHLLLEGEFKYTESSQNIGNKGFIISEFNQKFKYFLSPTKIVQNGKFEIERLNQIEFRVEGKTNYIQNVTEAVKDIQITDLDKIVLSRIKLIQGTDESVWQLYNELKYAYPDAFVYALYHKSKGIWLGASPELLLQNNNGIFETTAIAGTCPYRIAGFQDMWGEKELGEHEWLELYLDSILGSKKIEYSKSEKYTHQAGKLGHIRSDYAFKSSLHFLALTELLHPGPAISGFPREKALNWINSHENHERSLYAGFLGPVNFEGLNAVYTNIRCMQLFKDQCALYLGAGITKDSNPHDEFLETEQKSKTLGRFLTKAALA